MTNTQYYNLTKAEGSDTVNLLTQNYPNFDIIDNAMHANAVATVSTAVETKVGTTHQIVRTNSECAMFRFVATSNWTAGDSFTVDGVAVTAVAVDGQALQTGAFIINANVLCCVVGGLMTVYVGGGSAIAEDSLKLGGQLPAYYAKQSEVTTLNSNLIANADGTPTNFYFDFKNGEFGWNSDINRGADTFHPFKSTAFSKIIDNGVLDSNLIDGGYAYQFRSGSFLKAPVNITKVSDATRLIMNKSTSSSVDVSGMYIISPIIDFTNKSTINFTVKLNNTAPVNYGLTVMLISDIVDNPTVLASQILSSTSVHTETMALNVTNITNAYIAIGMVNNVFSDFSVDVQNIWIE